MGLVNWAYLALIIGSCGQAAAAANPSPYTYAEPEVLAAKAAKLGESEIARLAAAEMVYKNKVYYHLHDPGFNTPPVRVCMKLYRRFTGFEVVDIVRSDSVLRPLKITIRYNFDRVGTREIPMDMRNLEVQKRVAADMTFLIHDHQSLVREYFCTAQGDPLVLPSPYLARSSIFAKPGAPITEENSWVEDPERTPDRGR